MTDEPREWTRAEVRKALKPYGVKVRFEAKSYGTLIVVTSQLGRLIASTRSPISAIQEAKEFRSRVNDLGTFRA